MTRLGDMGRRLLSFFHLSILGLCLTGLGLALFVMAVQTHHTLLADNPEHLTLLVVVYTVATMTGVFLADSFPLRMAQVNPVRTDIPPPPFRHRLLVGVGLFLVFAGGGVLTLPAQWSLPHGVTLILGLMAMGVLTLVAGPHLLVTSLGMHMTSHTSKPPNALDVGAWGWPNRQESLWLVANSRLAHRLHLFLLPRTTVDENALCDALFLSLLCDGHKHVFLEIHFPKTAMEPFVVTQKPNGTREPEQSFQGKGLDKALKRLRDKTEAHDLNVFCQKVGPQTIGFVASLKPTSLITFSAHERTRLNALRHKHTFQNR